MEYIKYIKRQDCNWKQSAGPSGETSLNLSNDICSFLTFGLIDEGEESVVTFHIYKSDFINAIEFIDSQLPLYRSTSRTSQSIDKNSITFSALNEIVESFFGNETELDYSVTIYKRKDSRIYLKGLKVNNFTIRDFLVENSSAIKFTLSDKGIELRVLSAISEDSIL